MHLFFDLIHTIPQLSRYGFHAIKLLALLLGPRNERVDRRGGFFLARPTQSLLHGADGGLVRSVWILLTDDGV